MVDDLTDGEVGECAGVAADLFGCAGVDAWPAWCEHSVACSFEVGDPVFPAKGGHPKPMDKNDAWF